MSSSDENSNVEMNQEMKNFVELMQDMISSKGQNKYNTMTQNEQNTHDNKIITYNHSNIEEIADIENLEIDKIQISKCEKLHTIRNIKDCSVKKIEIEYCDVQNILDFENLNDLESISINYCYKLQNFIGLKNCSIEEFEIHYSSISQITEFENLFDLQKVSIVFCEKLQDIDGLKNCINLTCLEFFCTSLPDISPIVNLQKLEKLGLFNNQQLPRQFQKSLHNNEDILKLFKQWKKTDKYAEYVIKNGIDADEDNPDDQQEADIKIQDNNEQSQCQYNQLIDQKLDKLQQQQQIFIQKNEQNWEKQNLQNEKLLAILQQLLEKQK